MLQFDLDRLRAEHQNSSSDTPRVQSENKIIRDQIRHLLEEAKDKSKEVNKLKKAISMQDLYQEELEHKITMMKNKEIKLEEENEEAIEKYKTEEAKCRQLRLEYDELKFQFNRFKILSTDNARHFNNKYSIYDNEGNFRYTDEYNFQHPNRHTNDSYGESHSPIARSAIPTPQLTAPIKRKEWSGNDNNFTPPQNEEYNDYNEIISDKLYQKNMKSSIGELLRWDSTKDRGVLKQVNRRNNSVNQQKSANNQQNINRRRDEISFY